MNNKELSRRGEVVADAMVLIHDATNLGDVARALKVLIEQELWRDFIAPDTGERVTYNEDEWLKFVRTPPTYGLGANEKLLVELGKHYSDDLAETLGVMNRRKKSDMGKHGTNRYTSDSRPENLRSRTQYNSIDYQLARMKRDAHSDELPQDKRAQLQAIVEKAINGEMSISAAYTEAGFKPLRRAVNMEDAQSAYNTLTKFMPDDVLQELIELLTT